LQTGYRYCIQYLKYYDIFLRSHIETFEERPILAKYKEGDNFKRRNTLSISSIEIWAWRSNRAKGGVMQRSQKGLLFKLFD